MENFTNVFFDDPPTSVVEIAVMSMSRNFNAGLNTFAHKLS